MLEDVTLRQGLQWSPRHHFDATVTHHFTVQRVFRQAHVFGLGQGTHGAVEVGGACEVEQCTSELAVRHHNDVQAPMTLTRAREAAHAHVLLLLTVLLVADQVIGQEA